ncbi:hypothetical protein CLM62_14115 [Streptomyces sp. SA15]|nr:hypothetical protein CLM62_14115 [Streptomyces sp. SA15]
MDERGRGGVPGSGWIHRSWWGWGWWVRRVTGLRVPGISFDDPGRVRKTLPGFHEEFGALRARGEGRRG